MKFVECLVVVSMLMGCMLVRARTAQTGHLVVTLTDMVDGGPITNATVTVRCQTKFSLSHTLDSFFTNTSINTDSNGVADVAFQFYNPDFTWRVEAPSHYSGMFGFGYGSEQFGCIVEESEYFNIDTNTVEGLSKYNELKGLHDSGDVIGYLSKFEPRSVTYTNNAIYRSVNLMPKRNPKPMYAYGYDLDAYLPTQHTVCFSNDIELVQYKPADFDMQEGCVFSPDSEKDYYSIRVGKVADFHVERFCITTNGVRTFYGWLDFAPGDGAYIRKKNSDKSFQTEYAADTNATFLTRIPFEYHSVSGEVVSAEEPLNADEYMVLRTRVVTNSAGVVTNCNYSRILGPMHIEDEIELRHLVFNPVPNDPNLEFDRENNLAEDHGDSRYP